MSYQQWGEEPRVVAPLSATQQPCHSSLRASPVLARKKGGKSSRPKKEADRLTRRT